MVVKKRAESGRGSSVFYFYLVLPLFIGRSKVFDDAGISIKRKADCRSWDRQDSARG